MGQSSQCYAGRLQKDSSLVLQGKRAEVREDSGRCSLNLSPREELSVHWAGGGREEQSEAMFKAEDFLSFTRESRRVDLAGGLDALLRAFS